MNAPGRKSSSAIPRVVAARDADFYAWTQEQARLIRDGRFDALDRDHVAEEFEIVGASEKREIRARLRQLVTHLLKYRYQPRRRSRSWTLSVMEQREAIAAVLADSPSLAGLPAEVLASAYRLALVDAERQTRLRPSTLPESCPFTIAELLDPDWWPQAA